MSAATAFEARAPRPTARRQLHSDGPIARPPPPDLLAKARAAAAVRRTVTPPPRAAPVPHARQAVPPRPRPSKQLLLIDAERAFGSALSGWLARDGAFEVVQATSIQSAVDVLRKGKVDFIIATTSLPDGTAMDLLEDPIVGRTPWVMLSEQPREDRAKLGPDVHLLEKPVSPDLLRNELRTLTAVSPRSRAPANDATGPATLPPTAPETQVGPDIEELLLDARTLMAGREYEGALQLLLRARALRPADERVQQSLDRLQRLGLNVAAAPAR